MPAENEEKNRKRFYFRTSGGSVSVCHCWHSENKKIKTKQNRIDGRPNEWPTDACVSVRSFVSKLYFFFVVKCRCRMRDIRKVHKSLAVCLCGVWWVCVASRLVTECLFIYSFSSFFCHSAVRCWFELSVATVERDKSHSAASNAYEH